MREVMVICDTNIFIHAFNGNQETVDELGRLGHENICISTVTAMELYQGMGNKRELAQMKKRIRYYDTIEITEEISTMARVWIETFALSHGLKIPDALIGATAVSHDIELFTYNRKDFLYLPEIKLYEPL